MPTTTPALFKIEINWLRGLYIALFFCNAIFATMFKTIGRGLLSLFGTFSDCDQTDNTSCQGNQMVFRASFSISMFFLLRALLSRFGWVQPRARAIKILVWIELPVFIALLVGSFYIPNAFFDGYVTFTRIASGFFIFFQIFSIVSVSYGIERAEKATAQGEGLCAGSVCLWKTTFFSVCAGSLVAVGAGIAYLYIRYGDCSLGVAFTTITSVAAGLLIIVCVSNWMEVGLLPPCAISAYLVLMCWQALVSNPDKTSPSPEDEQSANTDSVIVNAMIAAFAMTWTSWRTSSAATKLLPSQPTGELVHEPWQFYSMMCLAGLYMAMVLTDWDSANGSFNNVSMWVKIVAQWSRKETEAADTSSAAPMDATPQIDDANDAQDVDASNVASDVAMETVELDKSGRDSDAAVGALDASEKELPDASNDVTMEQKPAAEQTLKCCECDRVENASRGDELRVCAGCKIVVHETCYVDTLPAAEKTEEGENSGEEEDEGMESSDWECDCCRRGVERRITKCVYCGKAGGEAALKVVETAADPAFWSQYGEFDGDKEASAVEMKFGHVLCINWDPRRLAAHTAKESTCKRVEQPLQKYESEKETSTDNADCEAEKKEEVVDEDLKEGIPDVGEILMRELPPSECCFCHSTGGVQLRTAGIPQFHAYCDRHRECTEDIGDLLAKLITRPIRLLVGRDDMRRFGTVAKHMPSYTSAAAVIRDLASLVVGYCHKGLRTSKVEPADYNVKHLQVLQFFLSHVPQLEKVYALPPTPAQDIVNDKKLFRRLEKAFNPPRYSTKYPGPFSQQYTCDHWRCTKRRSNIRERERYLPVAGNTTKKKRKAISIVQDGVRKEITLPKGLPSITDDIICGVCRTPVDARGLIASRKEAKRLDFEKKESKFVQNGCYINPIGAKGYCGYSHGTASTSSSRKPSKPMDSWKPNGTPVNTKPETNDVAKATSGAEKTPELTLTAASGARSPKSVAKPLVTPAVQALFNEAMRVVRPFDSYALTKLETAHDMLLHRSGPGVAVLRMLTQEYTRFVFIKHTRAVEKARNEKRKRAEHEAQEHREKERKRMNLEAERALKKQMLAMRNKQRQHLKATPSK
uniref:Zinc finger PHD-type domain-containing protein n=1 Tax=Phytophthora ramorum TaxID=164328 RepID=H3HCT0_PHYRM